MEAFREEYDEICKEQQADKNIGLDQKAFKTIVGEDESSDYYADENKLADILVKLNSSEPKNATTPTAAAATPAAKPESQPSPRSEMVTALFQVLDKNKNGCLFSDEIFVYAAALEYPGSAEDFREEYDDICTELKCDAKVGLDKSMFDKLVSDEEGNFHADDAKLKEILQNLQSPQAKASPPAKARDEQVTAIFQAADRNSNGVLNRAEMFKVAQAIGYPNAEEEFEEEWQELCKDKKADPAKGIDAKAFSSIVNDSQSDFRIEDSDLANILKAVRG